MFAWITYKSRGHRDRVNKQVMKDKRLAALMDPKLMPSWHYLLLGEHQPQTVIVVEIRGRR